jgi:hypothetical protein
MRTFGRVYALNPDGTKVSPQPAGYPQWVVVTTDANGFDDDVWLSTLCQTFLLNLGESPFYADRGLPAQPTIVMRVQPDFYVNRIQTLFAPKFANIIVAKESTNPPIYRVAVTKNNGAKVSLAIQIPQ